MLKKKDINNIVSQIKNSINPEKIYLFGSYASGKITENSDLDLLVIDNSGRKTQVVALEISKLLFPRKFGLDLIVVTPDEIEKKQNLTFWKEILKTGKKLYEQKRS